MGFQMSCSHLPALRSVQTSKDRTGLATNALRAAGITVGPHRPAQASAEFLACADLILTLDASVAADVAVLAPAKAHAVRPLMQFAPQLGPEVPDPWGGTDADYARAFDLIRAAVDGLLAELQRKGYVASTP